MLKNWNHDLVQQLSEISDSAWRMDQYLATSKDCAHCEGLWQKLKADYESHVELLAGEISRHCGEGRFD
ncbi:MAG: hypothetical protein HYT14_00215 [Candidatus Liptonbacteria bacterium]|nr:hypothetical protein [Candidatus Liptonbacteria bacterium]